MNMIIRLAAAITVGAMTAALATSTFGQADNTNSLTAPSWVPNRSYEPNYAYDRSYPYAPSRTSTYAPYPSSEPRYSYDPHDDSRRADMDQAGRRGDTMARIEPGPTPYERERMFGDPYADGSTPPNDARRGNTGVSQDSNPDDYATGIYNPKS
jgi:hypothetical protein